MECMLVMNQLRTLIREVACRGISVSDAVGNHRLIVQRKPQGISTCDALFCFHSINDERTNGIATSDNPY